MALIVEVGVGRGDSEAVYLMRGSVLSLSFVVPDRPNRQISASRREMGPDTFFFSVIANPCMLRIDVTDSVRTR